MTAISPRQPARIAAAAAGLVLAGATQLPIVHARQALPAPRVASYRTDATLDPAARRLTGRSVITWQNPGATSASTVQLHLYWNAWRTSRSTWLSQLALAGDVEPFLNRPPEDFGWQQLTALRVLDAGESAQPDVASGADLLPSLHCIQPFDRNPDDCSLAEATLPRPVLPSETLRLQVDWTAQVPRPVARTGAIGNYFFLAHWFPKLGAYETNGWIAREFFANTEFRADFGDYDVRLTVPAGWVVGATGREAGRDTSGAASLVTHHYTQEGVHDFAWVTSPDLVESTSPFEHATLPPVTMRLLLQPEHRGQEDRHFAATAAALKYYGEWFGAYPYPQLTIVDPAWQSASGGMEYPTLFTAGTRWLAPRRSNQPEAVTVHEAGHQFWYGMVASNEVTDAWLDEGLNTYAEERVQAVAFTPDYRVDWFFHGFVPWQQRDIPTSPVTHSGGLDGYRRAARWDVPATPTFRYWPGSHAHITYSKTALWLHTLERVLGWGRLQPALAAYFERFRFRHPGPDDFLQILNDHAGRDLTWFFDQVYRETRVFDYAVERVGSQPVHARGFPGAPSGTEPTFEDHVVEGRYRTTVVVRRLGDGRFPVDVLVTFADGSEVRESWDGQATWQAFTYDRPSAAVSAQVDPDRVLLLDVNYTNNSLTTRPRGDEAARHWMLQWVVWAQDLLLTYAFFV